MPTDERDIDPAAPAPASRTGGFGCLAGVVTAVAIPATVFCGILIANAMNPNCGTPADSGGCEMGLASGTIGAIVIGLGLGAVIAIVSAIGGRSRQ